MLKYWKKSMLAAGVLATLLAGSAFAATEAEDAATQQSGQDYNQKVEQQVPGAEKGRPFRSYKDGHHKPGPHQHKFHGLYGCHGHHHDGEFHRRHSDSMDRPGRLTQEQHQQLAKEREQFFANWSTMSDRERREATEKFIHRVNEERMKNMTDTEKADFEKRQAAKKAEREKIAKMTEDERHDYFKKKHDEMVKERTKNMTKEERHLWYDFLRNYPIRFRRQKIIGNYIADFYCSGASLVIELDGSQHGEDAARIHDQKRTDYFESFGLQVLRFSNLDVMRNFRGVCEAIDLAVRQR